MDAERGTSALWSLDPGCGADEHFRHACGAADAGVSFDEFNRWSQGASNYKSESDCRATWKSASQPGAIKRASLFRAALAVGWEDHTKGINTSRPKQSHVKPAPSPTKAVKTPIPGMTAIEVWERCIPATTAEQYIDKKGGNPDGLKVYPVGAQQIIFIEKNDDGTIKEVINAGGSLVVPCWSGDTLKTLQFITLIGKKKNLAGASFGDGYHPVGNPATASKIYITEGIGQAWATVTADPEAAAVCCFGVGRMKSVAATLRAKYPAAALVIVSDKGMEADAGKIAAAVAGHWVEMPDDKPKNYDCNDYLKDNDPAALLALLKRVKVPPVTYPLSVVFADELPSTFTPPDEIVEGVLTAGDGSVLYGDSNSGKTFFVIDMACAVARGVPWMGKQTEPGLVIYLAAESPASVRSRIQAYQRHYRVKVPNFAIVQSPIDLFDGDADTNKVIELVKQIEFQTGQPARLIIGDTLARLSAGANENAGQDMGLVVRRFDRIRTECKAHFMLIHHSGKNSAAGARGWSGVRAAVDTEIEITDSPTGRCCEIMKQRDLPTKGDRIGFRFESVTMGMSKWKAAVTSCVVVPADAPMKQSSKRISEVGGAIIELLRSKTGMKKKDVVEHFADRYVSSAVYRELKKLVEGGQVKDLMGVVSAEVPNGAN
jgi:putative DNA primase/helicase